MVPYEVFDKPVTLIPQDHLGLHRLFGHFKGEDDQTITVFAQLGAGAIDWRRVVRTLAAMSFSGPWAVHTEYGPDAVAPALERIAGEDVAYLRRIAAESAE